MPSLFAFQVRSIQAYLTAGGDLRTMIGASELVRDLSATLLETWLVADGFQSGYELAGRGSGFAYVLFDDDHDAGRAASLWPLICHLHAPGLGVSVASRGCRGRTDIAALSRLNEQLADADQRLTPALPSAPPVALRAPRTGQPAATASKVDDHSLLSLESLAKRRREGAGSLAQRVQPAIWEDHQWALDVSVIADSALLHGKGYYGYVAADVDGLGRVQSDLWAAVEGDSEVDAMALGREFTALVETAAADATRDAYGSVFPDREPGVVPARPIAFGGDDFINLLPCHLAIRFAEELAIRFELSTSLQLASADWARPWLDRGVLPDRLSLTSAVVFVGSGQPLAGVHRLAGSMVKHGKAAPWRRKLPGVSAIGWHRITGGTPSTFDAVLAADLRGEDGMVMTLQPFAIVDEDAAQDTGLPTAEYTRPPTVSALRQLATAVGAEGARGALREVLSLLHERSSQVEIRWNRMLKVLDRENPGQREALEEALARLGMGKANASPWSDTYRRCALVDAYHLMQMEGVA